MAATPLPASPQGFRALTPYWHVTLAAFLGWLLDAFDQTTLMFTLPDIARDFGCTLSMLSGALMGQAIGRAVGNTGWGWLADHYGRRPAFLLGVVWFALFSALTGLTHSLWSLIAIQFLFGVGFGGEWTASATLLMESVPGTLRPLASAIMMSGYEVGYLAAAGAQALVLPHYSWRLLFFIGLVPAGLALFIRIGVKESPLWLEKQAQRRHRRTPRPTFTWTGAALQAVALMGFLEFQKAAIYTFYPTILRGAHHLPPQAIFWPITLYCVGSFGGKLLCGRLAERFGNEKVMLAALALIMLTIWPFLCAVSWALLLVSAFIMGGAASGIFALVPHYLAQRFPSEQRSFGMGLSYALGSVGQGIASKLVPFLGATASALPFSAVGFVLGSSIITAAITAVKPRKMPRFND